jgi:predicted RNA-binding protein with PUA-like domain
MNRFLLKTEPTEYSFDDLIAEKRTVWSGVSNPLALKFIRSAKKGDITFIYHTGSEKQIVGIAKIISDAYPDPNDKSGKLFVFDIQPVDRLKKPVLLSAIKSQTTMKDFYLVKMGRLSVMPVTDEQWNLIISLSK